MDNNFIFNDNRVVLNGEEVSQSTKVYNFPNDLYKIKLINKNWHKTDFARC